MTPDPENASPSPDSEGEPEDVEMSDQQDMNKENRGSSEPGGHSNGANNAKATANSKDPSRPRRKKARRACHACQRAHLTCGDERPCTRCIKRGLAESCMDGVRKKAKYLHDAAPEDLMPGVGGHYPNSTGNGSSYARSGSATTPSVTMPQSNNFFPPAPSSSYDGYNNSNQNQQMVPPLSSNGSYANHRSPTSPTFAISGQQASPMSNMGNLPSTAGSGMSQMQPTFSMDASDPNLFNFDISSLNFGNQYGAMEFGMLGQMAGGTADSPSNDNHLLGSIQMPQTYGSTFADTTLQNPMFNQDPTIGSEWQGIHPRQNSSSSQFNPVFAERAANRDSISGHAYAIGAGPNSIASASPVSSSQDYQPAYDGAPSSPALYSGDGRQAYNYKGGRPSSQYMAHPPTQWNDTAKRPEISAQAFKNAVMPSRKRRRDHSYDQVTAPYSYTDGFHSLHTFLLKRYSKDKQVRIAQALSQFRPTLIHTYGQMNRDDLTFNEKVFQRLLYEYEDNFIQAYGVPAIILRRTGEVALANKEFCMLTQWKRDILLGKEANFNTNFGTSSGHQTGNSSRGTVNTPRMATAEETNKQSKPRSVLIAELLDHDSVVQFWEDCAKLAYVDPSGGFQRRCKLIKYRAKAADASEVDGHENGGPDVSNNNNSDKRPHKKSKRDNGDPLIKSEEEMVALGNAEGTVPCMFTWNIKRDIFDAPMMFVLTFMPIFLNSTA